MNEFEVIPNEQTPAVQPIADIKTFVDENLEVLQDFLEFAKQQRHAVGLAANQCSVNGQRLMINVFALRNLKDNTWSLVINPSIFNYIGMCEIKAEGCLTWKNKVVVAERYRAVSVSYYTLDNTCINEMHKGFEGQIWQHEVNHLRGIEERIEDDYQEKKIDIQRNDKCLCGSNKKYKNCCLLLI